MRKSLLLLLVGFTASTPGRAPTQAVQTVPCPLPVAAASQEPWQQISARGFTFCVPASWRATGRNTFRGDGGWVRWGTGAHPSSEVRTAIIHVPVEALPTVSPAPPGRYNRFPETIGGSVAEIWDNQLEGRFFTGAQWQTPERIYLTGEATDIRVRDLQLAIYRTVRFTPQ